MLYTPHKCISSCMSQKQPSRTTGNAGINQVRTTTRCIRGKHVNTSYINLCTDRNGLVCTWEFNPSDDGVTRHSRRTIHPCMKCWNRNACTPAAIAHISSGWGTRNHWNNAHLFCTLHNLSARGGHAVNVTGEENSFRAKNTSKTLHVLVSVKHTGCQGYRCSVLIKVVPPASGLQNVRFLGTAVQDVACQTNWNLKENAQGTDRACTPWHSMGIGEKKVKICQIATCISSLSAQNTRKSGKSYNPSFQVMFVNRIGDLNETDGYCDATGEGKQPQHTSHVPIHPDLMVRASNESTCLHFKSPRLPRTISMAQLPLWVSNYRWSPHYYYLGTAPF